MKTTVCSVFCVRSSDVSNENLFCINRSRVQLVVEISQYKYQHQVDMPTRCHGHMLQGSPLSGAKVPMTLISMCTCTAVLTYSALSDPHSHCFQWFPGLGGPRGKHPWQGLSSQTGLALTSRLRAGIGQLLPG